MKIEYFTVISQMGTCWVRREAIWRLVRAGALETVPSLEELVRWVPEEMNGIFLALEEGGNTITHL